MLKAELGFALSFVLVLCSCSHRQRMGADELRSELASATSLSAETELFLGYVRQRHATKHFAQGHIAYLSEELERSAKKLRTTLPPLGEEDAEQRLSTLVDALNMELQEVRGRMDQDSVLSTAQAHVRRIRLALNQINSSL
jgi:hypothetical protein